MTGKRGKPSAKGAHRSNIPLFPKDRIVAGRKPVLELLRHGTRLLEEIIVQASASFPPELDTALDEQAAEGLPIRTRTKEELDAALPDVRHQGIVAVLHPVPVSGLEEMVERSLSPEGRGLLVLLDQVADPHNLGAIMRVSEAAGADGLLYTKDRSATVTATVRKVSAGASELLPVAGVTNLVRVLTLLRARGYWIIGTGRGTDSKPLFQAELLSPIALVLGAEGKGLRKLTKEHCDVLVEIPMEGKIESLNVSQAASICLYEILRRTKYSR